MTCYHGIKIADMLDLISSPHQQKRHSPIYFEVLLMTTNALPFNWVFYAPCFMAPMYIDTVM